MGWLNRRKRDKRRTFRQCYLCERHSKISVFIVTLLFFSVSIELNYLMLIYLVIVMSETIDHEIETLTLEFFEYYYLEYSFSTFIFRVIVYWLIS